MQELRTRNLEVVSRTRNGIYDPVPHEPTIFAVPSSGVRYTVNITDDFDRPHTFDQVIALLSTATDEDEIVFNINSAGGYVDSLNMLLGWKAMCKARIVHVLMGDASSAASAFFLSKADQYIVGEGATMMIHEYQGGTFGTSSNMERRGSHSRSECERFIRKNYKDFLTEDEMQDALKGVELYFSSSEIRERLAAKLTKESHTDTLSDRKSPEDLEAFSDYLNELPIEEVKEELEAIELYRDAILKRLEALSEKD